MKWFRMYHEARNDIKLNSLTDAQFRVWFRLMCLACECGQEGIIPLRSDRIMSLEVAGGDVELYRETLSVLKELEILDVGNESLTFIHWKERQFKSDDVTTRVKRHREKAKLMGNSNEAPLHHSSNDAPGIGNVSEPPNERSGNVDETLQQRFRNDEETTTKRYSNVDETESPLLSVVCSLDTTKELNSSKELSGVQDTPVKSIKDDNTSEIQSNYMTQGDPKYGKTCSAGVFQKSEDPELGKLARMYEEEGFGALTEMVRETLVQMYDEFGATWVAEAMREAVLQNKRRLKYVAGILENWRREGGMRRSDGSKGAATDAKAPRRSRADPEPVGRYIPDGPPEDPELDEFLKKAGFYDIPGINC